MIRVNLFKCFLRVFIRLCFRFVSMSGLVGVVDLSQRQVWLEWLSSEPLPVRSPGKKLSTSVPQHPPGVWHVNAFRTPTPLPMLLPSGLLPKRLSSFEVVKGIRGRDAPSKTP